MLIRIGDFEYTEVWDGVLYKKLAHYPQVSPWEIRTLIEFIAYEKQHGRECPIECDNPDVLHSVLNGIAHGADYAAVPRPKLITECTACPVRKGCVTDFVCHTASPDNAVKILQCGKLLSACRARKLPAAVLMQENRNVANDPADYFDYVMLAWGNCQAGDRLVMERMLGRFPDENDLSTGFRPGVRFYFRYDHLITHPQAVRDGVLPMKIRDEILLEDWVHRIVIPAALQSALAPHVPAALRSRVIYVENDCRDIWDWSEKVYSIIERTADA